MGSQPQNLGLHVVLAICLQCSLLCGIISDTKFICSAFIVTLIMLEDKETPLLASDGASHSNKTILGCTTGMFAVFVMAEIVGAHVRYLYFALILLLICFRASPLKLYCYLGAFFYFYFFMYMQFIY